MWFDYLFLAIVLPIFFYYVVKHAPEKYQKSPTYHEKAQVNSTFVPYDYINKFNQRIVMKFTKRKPVIEWGNGLGVSIADAITQAGIMLKDEVQVSVSEDNKITIEKAKR